MIPPLFHISMNKALPTYLYPRQPSGLFNPDKIDAPPRGESIFKETLPPRISFSPSVTECFRAIWPNIGRYFTKYKYPFIEMYVYALVKGNEKCMHTPEYLLKNQLLWDVKHTQEHCFLTKVKIAKVAKIRIMNPIVSGKEQPMIHPHGNEEYDAVKASPDPDIKVMKIYNPALPLIINPV